MLRAPRGDRQEVRIRRFSSAAERLLNLIASDIGRPIAYIRTVMRARDLEQTVSTAIKDITVTEQRVRCADGYWYTMRIAPYRTAEHNVRGAVVEFLRSDPGEEREVEPADLRGLGGRILAAMPQAVAVLDERLRVVWCNRALMSLFEVGADVFGRPLEDLWGGKTDEPAIWTLIEDAVNRQRFFQSVVTEGPLGPRGRPLRISTEALPPQNGQRPLTLLVVEDPGQQGPA